MSARNRSAKTSRWLVGAAAAMLLTGVVSPAAAYANQQTTAKSGGPVLTGCVFGLNCGHIHHHHHHSHRASTAHSHP
ncbi:MAG: hypothetical protein ACRDTV_21580 [Mycobacterium sp.]